MPKPNITRFANLAIDPSLDPGNPYKTFRVPCLTQEEIDEIPENGLIDGIIIYNCTAGDVQTYSTINKKWNQAVASATTGLQIPNLTTDQRNAIPNPPNGTLIFHTDSNDLEVYDNGQWYDVIDRSIATVRPGTIMMWGGDEAPADWRECNGSELNRADFPDLFNAIGTNWGVGDGTTTFNIPDLRGLFVRGRDGGIGQDPDANSRTPNIYGGSSGDNVGSFQQEEFHSHSHDFGEYGATIARTYVAIQNGSYPVTSRTPAPAPFPTAPAGGNETRPKNANVLYIIKVV
ncbi:MAG: tail fiber protein [Candidatus Brocadiaceae bacterium]|nr:tail fiber protein [Candidatus Brocadiaceae bacterium]